MPRRFTHEEIEEQASAGITSVAGEIAFAARSVYCGLVQSSPFSVIYNNPLTSPIVTRTLESFCSTPPPNLPPPPFTGGQCAGVRYRVVIEYRINNGNLIEQTQNIWGTIKGTFIRQFQTGWQVGVIGGKETDPGFSAYVSYSFINGSDNPFSSERIVSIERQDGLPDDCGDPEGEWYEETPPPPDNIITNQTVVITNIANEQNEYNVTVNRSSDQHIYFPPVLNVNGVAVGIDVGGVSIGELNIGGGSGGEGQDGGDINQPGNPSSSGSEQGTEGEPKPIPEESLEEEVEGLLGIYVDITNLPSNAKISSGNGAPNIIYAGWIEFKRDSSYYPRTFIDFNNNFFPAPEGATGYAVTIKIGYTGQVRELTA